MNYVTAKEAKNILKINATTLKSWKDKGILSYKKLSDKKILYDIDSVLKDSDMADNRLNVIYARVSNTKQHNDLLNQIELVKSYCITNGIKISKVYQDIASGMNENRKDFNILINDVISGKIKNIYISFKDRLTRFGFDYFKNLFQKYNVNIIILDELEESNKTFQDELTEDLISIIHNFSMKLYSNRRKKLKEIEKILES
ncbi:MAG: IS607 family transposase [Candidatus Onthovivens sp.]|nr:IS607 family transposase [Candidatus Onthovivens sp.]